METIRECIDKYCKENGLTKARFFKQVGIKENTVYKTKDRAFNRQTLCKLYKYIGHTEAYRNDMSYRVRHIIKNQNKLNIDKLSTEDCMEIFEILLGAGVFDND